MTRVTKNAANHNGERLEAAIAVVQELLHEASEVPDFAGYEQRALGLGNEIVRRALERELQGHADAEAAVVQIDGSTYRRHQRGTVTYHSLVGGLRVTRWTYRERGRRNGPTIVPLQLRMMLLARATPALSHAVAHGYASVTSRQLARDFALVARAAPSRSTLERMGRALGARAYEELGVLEPRVRAGSRVPSATSAMHVGLDRTSAPMREPGTKGAQYRMAWVGTVALTDARGDLLGSWRYAAPACDGPSNVLARMMADVRKVQRVRPNLPLAIVQDGAIELWPLMRAELARVRPRRDWLELVDFYHLMQRVNAALVVCEEDARIRATQLSRWKRHLLVCPTGIERIRRFFALDWPPRANTPQYSLDQDREIDLQLGCYLGPPRFDYATARARGHHIGSGVTEGACKSLLMARAKRSGQRWTPQGLRAVLTLRSLLLNDRLSRLWRLLLKRKANVEALAA